MLTMLHISDIHFGKPYVHEVGEAVIKAAHEMALDVIIASGDFTQRARREEFAQARDFLNRLPKLPIVVVPGNHDVPLYRVFERIFNPYRLYREYISDDLDTVHHLENAVIVALNSTSPLRAITNGRLDSRQLDFCARAFADVPAGISRIVVTHHHLAPAPDYEGGQVMPRAKRAMDCFSELGVEMVLGGHLHRAYIGNSLDVYPGRDRERGIIIVQSGTATSRRGRAREREKNTLNLIRVGEDRIRITHFMYFDDLFGFAPISRHIFPRSGRHYLLDPSSPEDGIALASPVGVPDDLKPPGNRKPPVVPDDRKPPVEVRDERRPAPPDERRPPPPGDGSFGMSAPDSPVGG
ncbi:MAG: metallophosphoesterase [Gemmatimonadetes bacterium]|nr:metallophosphoesterase [Gemmatimonadota bacterium]